MLAYVPYKMANLQVFKDRMFFDAREENAHGVGSVVQKRDPCSIKVTGQLVDIRLQLRKCWRGKKTRNKLLELSSVIKLINKNDTFKCCY